MLFLNILIQNTIKAQYFPVNTNESKNKPKRTPMLALKLATNFSSFLSHFGGEEGISKLESSSYICINDCLLPSRHIKIQKCLLV